MSDAEGILGLPLYLIEVIPELKIEGQTIASGQAIGMGTNQLFEMTFSDPTGIGDQVVNTVQSGEYHAIGLDVNKVTFQSLKDRVDRWQPDTANERDDRLGELLYLMAMFYFANSGFLREEASKASGVMALRHPSESMVSLNFNADFLFGIPVSISSVGLNMDVDRDILSPFSKNGNSDTTFWFMVRNGLNASAQEHLVFESIMGLEAISTVKFLDLANSQLVPAYVLDSENVQRVDELQISSQDKADIRNFINAGKMVIVPNRNIQHVDYSGIGYNVVDLETGVGGYLISGGFNGSATVAGNVAALIALAEELIGKDNRVFLEPIIFTLKDFLDSYPEIAGQKNPAFQEFTKRQLHWGHIVNLSPVDGFKVNIAFEILYHARITLITLIQ
ncbi:MAG: hypothetical protein GXO96_08930 [Nitrospirae bacterium]|nr:hypothetical protein [Candidatus Manganitrophaceae bacterium]